MAARAVTLALLCLAFAAATASGAQHAPAPAVDCSSLILNMADCLSYVSNGSTVAKPEGTCCTGLKTVLKADADCLCEAFKSSAQLGVVLNVTKAIALPAACKVSAPAAAKCALSTAPTGAPALSPTSAVSPDIAAATPEVASGPASGVAPALSPGASGSTAISVSIGSIVVGLVVAAFSGFRA